ncbi:MAG: hypothetical protein KC544_15380 [Gemmatimonadetes bacterium]|nr:hypothetical protein [Gemmatimonadota bacterium]
MPSSPLVRIALTAAVTVAIGCGAPAPDAVTRRDSLGIELVENPRLAEAPATVVFATTSVFDVGGLSDNPDLELPPKGMHDAMRIASGAVIVSSAYELRLYSADGTLLRTLGRKGEGPGEFTSQIWGLCRLGRDTVLALEVPAPRLGVTGFDLDTLYTVGFDGRALHRACTPTGFLASLGRDETGLGAQGTMTVLSIDANGRQGDTLGQFPGDDYESLFPHEAGFAAGAGLVAATDGIHHEYRQYRLDGTLSRIVRTRDEDQFLDREGVHAMVRKRLGPEAPEGVVREGAGEFLRGASRLPRPAFVLVNVDDTGRVWLSAVRELGGPLQHWAVFDSTGTLRAVAEPQQVVPEGAERAIAIRWTTTDFVFQYNDADGALHVRMVPYTLQAVAAR